MTTAAERFKQLQEMTAARRKRERLAKAQREARASGKPIPQSKTRPGAALQPKVSAAEKADRAAAAKRRAAKPRVVQGSYRTPKNPEKLPSIAKDIVGKMEKAKRWTRWLRGTPRGQ